MKNLSLIASLLLSLLLAVSVHGFTLSSRGFSRTTSTSLHAEQQQQQSRASFLSSFFLASCTAAVNTVLPVQAKEVDASIKGTKQDPAYEACLSSCLYECTKPKGDEQKTRAECRGECKQKCATTKQQLMIGTPKA